MKNEKRQIEIVGKVLTFADAEAEDNLFWSGTTALYRLQTLIDLREIVFSDNKSKKIKKVVLKRNIHENQD